MKIDLQDVGMRFGKEFLFRKVNRTIEYGEHTAITGFNGSGKSTLLQIVSGAMLPFEGEVEMWDGNKKLESEEQYQCVCFATPYADLIEELTVGEIGDFQKSLISTSLSGLEITKMAMLEDSVDKPIAKLSSGMKQRLKLCLALGSGRPWVFLDEPCSNLDEKGVQWYMSLLDQFKEERSFIICSNHYEKEFHICTETISVEDYKTKN